MLCTSRPAGLDEARFADFYRLKLAPLTEEQQLELDRREGDRLCAKLKRLILGGTIDDDFPGLIKLFTLTHGLLICALLLLQPRADHRRHSTSLLPRRLLQLMG